MSCVLDTLDIEELKIRKTNLLVQIERIDNELKRRISNINKQEILHTQETGNSIKIKVIIKKK